MAFCRLALLLMFIYVFSSRLSVRRQFVSFFNLMLCNCRFLCSFFFQIYGVTPFFVVKFLYYETALSFLLNLILVTLISCLNNYSSVTSI